MTVNVHQWRAHTHVDVRVSNARPRRFPDGQLAHLGLGWAVRSSPPLPECWIVSASRRPTSPLRAPRRMLSHQSCDRLTSGGLPLTFPFRCPDGLATGPTVSNDKVLGNVFACASQSRRQLDDGSGDSVSVPLGRAPLRQTQTQDRHAAAQLQRVASSSVIPLLRLAQWKRCEVGRWRGSRPTVAQRASRTHELGSAPPLPPVPPQAAAPPVQDGMECEGPRRLGPSLGSEGHTDGAHPQTSPGATANSQQDASTTATGTSSVGSSDEGRVESSNRRSQDAAAHILDQDHQRKPENECASLAATL
ncbi:hypothetical protein Purlil1_3707 [Purpureocillium lilacinum]|uniref:Uncharacterized protein n=1 Tax=Purpureocillium lilacinum TaxID=33203 RepID=A0ABR0C7B7_PURLI|nr:hypothetical protein Purlil1_3707 [Purpureocillium lilacinum]